MASRNDMSRALDREFAVLCFSWNGTVVADRQADPMAVRSRVEPDLAEYCRRVNVAIIPYSPLEGGLLTGKYQPGKPLPENARSTDSRPAPTPRIMTVASLRPIIIPFSPRNSPTFAAA